MTISQWGAVAIALLGVQAFGCTADKFSACDGCDDGGAANGGTNGASGGTNGASGTGGTLGEGGSSGSGGSSGLMGTGGSAGARDAGGGTNGSGGSAGTAGSSGTGGTQGGEAFPRTAVLDDFNREDGPPGSNWLGNTSSFAIKGGRLSYVSSSCGATLWQSLFGAEQEVFARLAGINSNASEINIVLKAQDLSDCELLEVMYSPADRRLELHYCSGGLWHTIDGIALTLQPGDQLGARFNANSVHVFVNGVRATIFDASEFPHRGRGGRIGVNCEANADGTTAWDDFGGG
jgi:hypothetical protein